MTNTDVDQNRDSRYCPPSPATDTERTLAEIAGHLRDLVLELRVGPVPDALLVLARVARGLPPDALLSQSDVLPSERSFAPDEVPAEPDPERLVGVRPDGLTDPSVLRLAAGDLEQMQLGWGGLPRSLPGTLRTLADALDEQHGGGRS